MSPGSPSQLVVDQLAALRAAAEGGPVVDLACGRGRHALFLARAGIPVLGIDRNEDSLAELATAARAEGLSVRVQREDLETGAPLPLAPGSCSAILVFRYLHRPLCPDLAHALAPGGLLLYETFTIHQRELGYGPGRDEFLLNPEELPGLFPDLEPLHHWEGRLTEPREAEVAQLVARNPVA